MPMIFLSTAPYSAIVRVTMLGERERRYSYCRLESELGSYTP